jgi:hypothetical protein
MLMEVSEARRGGRRDQPPAVEKRGLRTAKPAERGGLSEFR